MQDQMRVDDGSIGYGCLEPTKVGCYCHSSDFHFLFWGRVGPRLLAFCVVLFHEDHKEFVGRRRSFGGRSGLTYFLGGLYL